jgi:short-subunit dehydrogenase
VTTTRHDVGDASDLDRSVPMRLNGTVALVTGASRGIGRATALALAARGATVVGVGLDADDLDSLAAETGGSSLALDVRDPGHADSAVRHALERHGRLDVVVANAGIGHEGELADMSPQRITELVEVNVLAPMLMARAALPVLLTQGQGALVFMSSIAGALLVPRESVYSATKAAIQGFAEPLRDELHGTGITVTTVLPTAVRTGFFDERGAPYGRRFPRPLPPERIAAAVVSAVEQGRAQVVVPRWLAVPIRLHGAAPSTYRRLARRFG